jgi:hypothetical protein
MANPDYYDLRKLRTLVDPTMRKQTNNPNTAYYNSTKFVPPVKPPKQSKTKKPKD